MAIDFPNAPSPGATFTANSKTWTFTDNKWRLNVSVGGVQGPAGVAIQETAPATTDILWVDTSDTGLVIVPAGGTTGQVLAKSSSTSYDTAWATPVTSSDLALKANLASPTFTGTPTLPTGTIATTQTASNNTTAVATTAYVDAADNLKANLASPTFTGTPTLPTGTIATTQTALDSSTKVATTAFVTTADALKAPLASPTFTGTPTLPTGTIATTQAASNNSTAVATTAYVDTADALKANLASPTFTGTPTLPTGTIATTQTASNNSTAVATTAYVDAADALKANLASPTFTGTPTLPTGTIATTQTAGNNTTAVATTAFVSTAVANLVDSAPATLNTLDELALALGDDANFATTTATAIGLKAPLVSPSFTTPALGVATATSVNGTTIPTSKTLVVTTDKLSAHAATTSAELAGVISDETGTGALVFGTSPTITTPNMTRPVMTAQGGNEGGEINLASPPTGSTISGGLNIDLLNNSLRLFEAGGTNRGMTIDITTLGATAGSTIATTNTAQTLTNKTLTSPTLTTPALGVATATSVNGTTIPTSKTLVVTTDKLSAHAATTSAELAGVISDETGTGSLVFSASPALTGTPTSPTAADGTNSTQIATMASRPWNTAWGFITQSTVPAGTGYITATTDLTSVTFTAVANRRYRYFATGLIVNDGVGPASTLITDNSNNVIREYFTYFAVAGGVNYQTGFLDYVETFASSGSVTRKLRHNSSSMGVYYYGAAVRDSIAWKFRVEDIGPA